MKIKQIEYTNFKGLEHFILNADCKDLNIFGDNETGKTTLFDGFIWLLFDKDSLNQSNFEIKPIGQHGLTTSVRATIDQDGRTIELKKDYYEKWVKERGSAEKVFSGHTTDYYIDGVPVKKSDYDGYIKSMADETAFKLLTNPLYFNEVMHWTDRRNLLIKACGDVNKEDIFGAEPKLNGIRLQLENRKIEDHKKVLQARRKEINDKIERIPIRIDEVSLSMPAIADIDFDSIREQIDILKRQNEEYRTSIGNIQNGTAIGEKKLRISQIDTEINGLRNEIAVSNNNLTVLAKRELRESEEYLEELKIKLNTADNNAAYLKSLIATSEQKKQAKLDEWNRENETVFVEPVMSDVCYACGQKLPEGRTENQKQKALEDFNLRKSQKLESIVKEAKGTIVPMIEAYEAQLATAEKLKEELFLSIKKQLDVKEAKKQVYDEISGKAIILEADEKYIALMNEKQKLTSELDDARMTYERETESLKESLMNNDRQITALQSEYAKQAQYENARTRVEELKSEEKLLAKELLEIDKELDLVELYIKTQVGMLDEKINSRFAFARFKLFNVQVNGGIEPCCECTYKGVPYSSMNNAARINIGIDIINTLSLYYKFSAPLWIDNAESVVNYIPTSSQIIKLIVSGADKILRVQEV
jgi:hypothetical protein